MGKRTKRFLVNYANEEEISHKSFDTHRKALDFMKDKLEFYLPEELQTDYAESFMESIQNLDISELDEETLDMYYEMAALLEGKRKMAYRSKDDSLTIDEDVVLFRSVDGKTIFNAEIIDIEDDPEAD